MGVEIVGFLTEYIEIFSLTVAIFALFRPELGKLTHKIVNKIDFYPHSRIELGFFDLGPTIGIQFTIRGRGGNQLIRSMSLKLSRERDGATYNYKWGLFRVFSASKTGTNVEESLRAELATAFLLPKDEHKILNVLFHDPATQGRFTDEVLQLKTKFEDFLYAKQMQPKYGEEIISAQKIFKNVPENNELVLKTFSRLGKEFYWEGGQYKLTFTIETDKPYKAFKFQYSFSLSDEEVARMELNKVGLTQAVMLSTVSPNFVNVEMQTT